MIQKILSYLYPFNIKKYHSKINGNLEINLINGKKTLDTEICNYSYGVLQKILHRGLTEINFPRNIEKILILGLGGGSIIETIRNHFKSNSKIIAVEIDPKIIEIAIKEFDINKFENVNIINDDAYNYLNKNKDVFDLIIIDIFIKNTIPEKFKNPLFIYNLNNSLNKNGNIIYNTMIDTISKESFDDIINEFSKLDLEINILTRVEFTNNLIFVKKKY